MRFRSTALYRPRKWFSLLLILSITLIMLVAFIAGRSLDNNHTNQKQVSTQTPTDDPLVDTVNDGVYKDYIYGFKFEYPKDIFLYQHLGSSGSYWVNEEPTNKDNYLTVYSDTAVTLEVLIRDTTPYGRTDADHSDYRQSYIDRFNEFLQIKTGEKASWGAQKLSESISKDYKQITYYYETPHRQATEYSTSYGAWWLKDGLPVINLNLIARKDSTLREYKNAFDKIVESFEFF